MALISKIRKNSWILVVLIALGLIGFIVMDMTSGQQSIFGSSQFTLGSIDGKKLDWNHFSRVEQILYGNSGGEVYSRRQSLWNYFVEEAIVQEEAEGLGLGISKSELMDLQFGPDPSPIIKQRFADPATRQVNFQQLNDIRKAIEEGTFTDPRMRSYWAQQEKEIIKERLQSKINNLIAKAVYTPTWMAEMGYVEQNQAIDFNYVKIPFDEIDNTEVTLSDDDYKQYIKDNEARLKQDEETRKLEYVVFDILPSAADSTELKNKVAELVPDFEATDDDSAFVARNYGDISANYFSKEELPAAIADTAFQIPVGSVYGPYSDGGSYQAVKILGHELMADSADSRHILIPADTPEAFTAAKKTIDSLENLLLAGASFDTLALKFSKDPGSANKGGKYEGTTPNQFVPEYNEVLFVTGQIGKLYSVRTSYGWHLVEVLSRSASKTERVKVAFIREAIVPSEATQNEAYQRTQAFVGQNRDIEQFRKSVQEMEGLEMEISPSLKKNDFNVGNLGAAQASRDMIRWAFNASKGDVSPEIYAYQDPVSYYTNKYVLVALRSIQKAGLPSVENIKDEIEQQVINIKKGELIKQRIQGTDLAAIAANFKTKIDTATNVTFAASYIPTLGSEPALIGEVFNLEQGQISKPVVGNAGVYVAKVTNKPAVGQANNIPQMRKVMAQTIRSQINGQLIQAMKKNADIEDYRSKFY